MVQTDATTTSSTSATTATTVTSGAAPHMSRRSRRRRTPLPRTKAIPHLADLPYVFHPHPLDPPSRSALNHLHLPHAELDINEKAPHYPEPPRAESRKGDDAHDALITGSSVVHPSLMCPTVHPVNTQHIPLFIRSHTVESIHHQSLVDAIRHSRESQLDTFWRYDVDLDHPNSAKVKAEWRGAVPCFWHRTPFSCDNCPRWGCYHTSTDRPHPYLGIPLKCCKCALERRACTFTATFARDDHDARGVDAPKARIPRASSTGSSGPSPSAELGDCNADADTSSLLPTNETYTAKVAVHALIQPMWSGQLSQTSPGLAVTLPHSTHDARSAVAPSAGRARGRHRRPHVCMFLCNRADATVDELDLTSFPPLAAEAAKIEFPFASRVMLNGYELVQIGEMKFGEDGYGVEVDDEGEAESMERAEGSGLGGDEGYGRKEGVVIMGVVGGEDEGNEEEEDVDKEEVVDEEVEKEVGEGEEDEIEEEEDEEVKEEVASRSGLPTASGGGEAEERGEGKVAEDLAGDVAGEDESDSDGTVKTDRGQSIKGSDRPSTTPTTTPVKLPALPKPPSALSKRSRDELLNDGRHKRHKAADAFDKAVIEAETVDIQLSESSEADF